MANGQMTTVVDGSQNHFLAPSSQIESTRPSKSPTGISSPSVVGIKPGGVNTSVALGSDSRKTRLVVGGQSEVEEADPDVIPNQYGTRQFFYWLIELFCYFKSGLCLCLHFLPPPERRPIKYPAPMPLFNTSTAYGIREMEDGMSLSSFQNLNSEVHYTFQPSHQIVSRGWVVE